MRTFVQVQEALDLQPWSKGTIGHLYLPRSLTGQRLLVRHFDTEELAGLVGAYAEVVESFERWIAERPRVAEYVEIQAVTEIGIDFVARPYHIYYYALDGYDDPVENDLVEVIPDELAPMRDVVGRNTSTELRGRAAVLQEVIRASLLGPSRATIMGQEQWLVVSPSITLEQLERWAGS